jgi:hypothetical protein
VRAHAGMPLWVEPTVHGAECRRFDSYVVKGPRPTIAISSPARSARTATVYPVDAVVVLPQLDQGRTQDGVTLGPLRRAAGPGRVVGARGHLHAC